MKYKIIFRGKTSSDIDHDSILENLSELFDEPVEEINERFFKSKVKEFTLISGLDNDDAQEYQIALLEAGIFADIDLDIEDFNELDGDLYLQATEDDPVKDRHLSKVGINEFVKSHEDIELILEIPEPKISQDHDRRHKNIHQQFLEAQDFTLIKNEETVFEGEETRVAKLKKLAQKRDENLYVDDRDIKVVPPLFHSGVRIGRLRFLYRITLALAILFACLNIVPLYLQQFLGNAGFVLSFIILFLAAMFVLMIISQRFCDIDNLSIGKMLFVTVILSTFIFSFFVHEYYSVKDSQIAFAKNILDQNTLNPHYFAMKASYDAYLNEVGKIHIIKRLDDIVTWFVYLVMVVGSILLFAMPGITGNNQFGAPSSEPDMKSGAIFGVSLIFLIYSATYPFSTASHRGENQLYLVQLYEYMGILQPLPSEFNSIYKDYLVKNSTRS